MSATAFVIGDFSVDPVVLAALALALLAAMVLAARSGGRRRAALIALQPLAAGLLLAALSLREAPAPAALIVLTPGADAAAFATGPRAPRVGLPGAPQGEGIERVPDLATALRRHRARHLIVHGDGLRAHDREAVGARSLEFRPSPASTVPSIVELEAPAAVRAGSWWMLRGRVHASAGTMLVLLDPGGAQVAQDAPDEEGRFALDAIARAAGTADFELQLRRGEDVLQTLPVPLSAQAALPPRVMLLAAAPSPELKYLRRWALDAGVQLDARIALAPGLAQRRGPATLDAAQLAQLDLLIVDERSWPQLAALQPALREAVASGLGLLVRTTGAVPERVAREWAAWGLAVPNANAPQPVRVAASPRTQLHAWPAPVDAAQPLLLAASDGTPLAQWQARGRGRVGSWRLLDTHRLYTRGERERHATLWADAVATLARARGEPAPRLPEPAVAGERATVCDLAQDAAIVTPRGERAALSIENGCAAFWPREAGWHRLQVGDTEHRFSVRDPHAFTSLLAHERRAATQALVHGSAPAPTEVTDRDSLRALLLAAWLAVMALAWWLERRRGDRAVPATD